MADRASVWQQWSNCTKRLRTAGAVLLGLFASGGCTSYELAYEKSVYDLEPVYCYRSLADVTCFRKPYFRDERRLANYYGPAPSKYDRPKPPPMAELQPPPPPDLDNVDDPDSVDDSDSDDGEEMEGDVGEEEEQQEEGEDVEEASPLLEVAPAPVPDRHPAAPSRPLVGGPMVVSIRPSV